MTLPERCHMSVVGNTAARAGGRALEDIHHVGVGAKKDVQPRLVPVAILIL